MLDISSETFNLIEGFFWLFLGMVTFIVYLKIHEKFKTLALFSIIVLVTFGLSDFFQVFLGSFLQPHLWWLFLWKVIDVIGFVIIFVWYLVLRLR